MQAAADVLPGGIGRCGILLLAERTHIADGRHAHVRVAADAADGAALLVNAEEERNFCVGLRVFQQRDGLFAVFKVFREIHDAADRVLLQRFLCRLPRYGGGVDVCDGLRRYEEQLPDFFLVRHGIEKRLRRLLCGGGFRSVRRLRVCFILIIRTRLWLLVRRLRLGGLAGKLALVGRFALRLYGRRFVGKHAVRLDGLGLLGLLLFRERLPQKDADAGQQRDAEQNGEHGG